MLKKAIENMDMEKRLERIKKKIENMSLDELEKIVGEIENAR